MKKIKINLKPLVGIDRKITVFPSINLMLEALDLSATIESQTSGNNLSSMESINSTKKAFTTMLDFIQKVLNLSDKEMEYFKNHSTPEKVGDVLGRIVMVIRGTDPETVEKVAKKHELQKKVMSKDPKK